MQKMEHKPGIEQWHFQSYYSIDKVTPQDISAIVLDRGVSVCSPSCKHQRITLSDLLYSRLPMKSSIYLIYLIVIKSSTSVGTDTFEIHDQEIKMP